MNEATDDFKKYKKQIEDFTLDKPLMDQSGLLACLKRTARDHVFVSQDVRKIEADGYNVIGKLMDFYWHAITNREDFEKLDSKRTDALAAYGISKISDNYLQCANKGQWMDRDGSFLPMRYRELRLLTDMVSGMTDGYAKSEYDFLHANDFV